MLESLEWTEPSGLTCVIGGNGPSDGGTDEPVAGRYAPGGSKEFLLLDEWSNLGAGTGSYRGTASVLERKSGASNYMQVLV